MHFTDANGRPAYVDDAELARALIFNHTGVLVPRPEEVDPTPQALEPYAAGGSYGGDYPDIYGGGMGGFRMPGGMIVPARGMGNDAFNLGTWAGSTFPTFGDVSSQTRPRTVTQPTPSGGGFDWNAIPQLAAQTLSTIFTARAQASNPAAFQPPGSVPRPPTADEIAAAVAATRQAEDEDVAAKPGHLKIFGAQIPYTTLLVVGVGFMLLQSRPLSRR